MKPKFITSRLRNNAFGASLVSSIAICLSGVAHATDWTGDTDGNWNNNLNWAGDAGTGGSNAIINLTGTDVSAPYTATITSDFTANPNDVFVGSAGGAGLLNHPSGNGNVNFWMYIGRNDGASGTYNLTASTTADPGTLTLRDQGTGSMYMGGRLWVGGWNAGGGTGTCNVHTTGTLRCGDLTVGSGGGTGTMNVDSGIINTFGWNFIGKREAGVEGATGTLSMSGGTLTNTGRTFIGSPQCTGTLTLSGGTYKNVNDFVFIVGGTVNDNDFIGTSGGTGHVTINNSASLL